MKTIEQDGMDCLILKLETAIERNNVMTIHQLEDGVAIDKQGAKQLIEVLKEWVGESDNPKYIDLLPILVF